MSTSRQRGLSARVTEDVYTALSERAQADGITVSSLVARVLGEAVGEEVEPTDIDSPAQPDPEPATGPGLVYGTVLGEEMITRREAERLRWQWEVEHWQRDAEARQTQLERCLAALDRRLAEAVVPENSHPWGQDSELYETKASGADLQREIEGLQRPQQGVAQLTW